MSGFRNKEFTDRYVHQALHILQNGTSFQRGLSKQFLVAQLPLVKQVVLRPSSVILALVTPVPSSSVIQALANRASSLAVLEPSSLVSLEASSLVNQAWVILKSS